MDGIAAEIEFPLMVPATLVMVRPLTNVMKEPAGTDDAAVKLTVLPAAGPAAIAAAGEVAAGAGAADLVAWTCPSLICETLAGAGEAAGAADVHGCQSLLDEPELYVNDGNGLNGRATLSAGH